MRKQSIVNRWSALDAAGDYLTKVTLGIDSAIEISRRVLLSSRAVMRGEIGCTADAVPLLCHGCQAMIRTAYNGGTAQVSQIVFGF